MSLLKKPINNTTIFLFPAFSVCAPTRIYSCYVTLKDVSLCLAAKVADQPCTLFTPSFAVGYKCKWMRTSSINVNV